MNEYFKAEELVRELKVSERTVYRWVEETKLGELKLDLIDRGEKSFIAKTDSNLRLLKALAKKRLKFKNKRSLVNVKASGTFYKVFTENHIFDLIKSIEISREIPLKYSYLNGGASSWDLYARKLWSVEETTPKTKELTSHVSGYILSLVKKYKKVNIIDIGPGNGLPVKEILGELVSLEKLNKYIAIDISPDMLEILSKNIKNWFGDKVDFEGIVGDITRDTFQSTAFRNISYEGENTSVINVILYLGGSVENDSNYSQQLGIINSSMSSNDIFILEQGVDNGTKDLRFRFGKENIQSQTADLAHRKMVLDLLGIDESLYNVERFYSDEIKAKVINVRFTKDVVVSIESKSINRNLIFQKGDALTIWRYNCHSTMEVIRELNDSGFHLLSIATSLNKESAIFITEIRKAN